MHLSQRSIVHATLMIVGLLGVLAAIAWQQRPDGYLHLSLLTVTGDAALLRTPAGRFVLIDGGTEGDQLLLLLGRLMPFWQRDLQAVILTGTDSKRVPGQVAALSHYAVGYALAPPGLGRTGYAGEWQRLLGAHATPVARLRPGQRFALDDVVFVVIDVQEGKEGGVVLLVTYGTTRVLFHTGGRDGDQAALRAAKDPVDLLIYPWARELQTSAVQQLRPRAIAFSSAYSTEHPVLLSYAERRRFSPQVQHPRADGRIEWMSDGRTARIVLHPD